MEPACKKLWAQLFLESARDYKREQKNRFHAQDKLDADYWFASMRTSVGSFLWVAKIFDLKPNMVRARLEELEYSDLHNFSKFLNAISIEEDASDE